MEHLSEKNFVKLLEYISFVKRNGIELIAKRLSLQVFYETQVNVVYTVASTFFVIDVYPKLVKVYFVDKKLQENLSYVERYMNYYFKKYDYKMFYFILRYLTKCENTKGSCEKAPSEIVCSCIYTENPGVFYTFNELKEINAYNIFVHREEPAPEYLDVNIQSLEHYHKPKELSIKDDRILIEKNGTVYLNGKRCGFMSYLFRKGMDIFFCYYLTVK